jgi:5-methylcytosine-specific restriction endonuclease McrA
MGYGMTWLNSAARARAHGGAVERFEVTEIYERDEWCCWICRQPVDPALCSPDPLSKSLDHVVPISERGPHARDNVRLAHAICNSRRSDAIVAAKAMSLGDKPNDAGEGR